MADEPAEKQYTGQLGNEYRVSFDESEEVIVVSIENPTGKEAYFGFHVSIDEWYHKSRSGSLAPGASERFKFDLTEGFDVMRDNHSVKFSAGPEPLWFNYTKDVDPSTTAEYATPELTNVTLREAMFRGAFDQVGQDLLFDLFMESPGLQAVFNALDIEVPEEGAEGAGVPG
ncbi:MAG: hypothetical protein ABEI52_05045, partial [Halobacteriaceae archaeon]